jgi:ABC-type multidrug transport system fused ATPase/permease subunit
LLFAIGLFAVILSSIVTMAFPKVLSMLIDLASGVETVFTKNQIVLVLGIILVIQVILSFTRIFLFAIITEKSMADLRNKIFNKLLQFQVTFFEKRRVGDLISRITNDITNLQDLFATTLAELIRQIITFFVGIILILTISVKLTLVMLSVIPVIVVVGVVFARYIRSLSGKVQDKLADANVIVEETLQNIQIVKAYNNEVFEDKRYNRENESIIKLAIHAAKYRGGLISFFIVGMMTSIVIVLFYGTAQVETGTITIGKLTEFIIYTAFIGAALGGIGENFVRLQKSLGCADNLLQIIEKEDERENILKTSLSIANRKATVEFKNVSFRYPAREDVEVLKDISFEVKQGERVALVGYSGAGKSTIIQLILKFYSPNKGQIVINDIDIASVSESSVRQLSALVPQDVMLFGGSIRDNIRYGKLDANDDEVMNAAKRANAWEFISGFPEGLDTLVGEKGVKLSGGQKQRIAIARAILRDPDLLILDEATSSLDAQSESYIQEALEAFMENRTTIIIAHRLSTVKSADKILVIRDGHIVEQGRHEDLIAIADGYYNELLKLQLQS